MNLNLKIFAGDVQIGYMPNTAMLATGESVELGDVLNSWALYTRRNIDPNTTLGILINALSQSGDVLGELVSNADGFVIDVAQQENLPVMVSGDDVRYVVLESETLDFGLVEATLQLESDYKKQMEQTDNLDAVEYNLGLVHDYLVSRLSGALAKRKVPAGAANPTITINGNTTVTAKPATTPAPRTTNVAAPVAVDGFAGVQIASGFFGVNDGHVKQQVPATPAAEAKDHLARFLANK